MLTVGREKLSEHEWNAIENRSFFLVKGWIETKVSWTKADKLRDISIRTPEQCDLVDRVRLLEGSG